MSSVLFHAENLMSKKDNFAPELILYDRDGAGKRGLFSGIWTKIHRKI